MTAEKVYFEHDGVKVTSSRLVVDNQTFAMNGITSVSSVENKPKRWMPILMLAAGLLVARSNSAATLWDYIIFSVPGLVWLALQRSMFSIRIGSASGESQAMQSKQKEFANAVVAAVNTAIIERG